MPQIDTIKRIMPPIVSLAIFMEAVDTTIINTAIPSMANTLDVSVIDLKLALISYLVSLAVFIPISSWLADKFGIKNIFMSAIAIFTVGSIFCGFAGHLYELVFFRFIQGMGGAFMIPVGRLIIVRLFERTELISAMNKVIIPALMGPALGPLLGGVISEMFSWRWIFWVNIPFGILGLVLAYYWVENKKAEKLMMFDWKGFLLFGLGLAGMVFAFSAVSESEFPLKAALGILGVSCILLAIFAYYSTHSENPVLKVKLFLVRTFRTSIIGSILTRIGSGGLPFLLPLFLQIPLGFSPESAGLVVAMTALGAIVMKFFSQQIISKYGFKKMLLINTVFLGLGFWLFLGVHHGTALGIIAVLSFIYGLFIALQFSLLNPLSYSKICPEDLGFATSMVTIVQQIGASFGVALSAIVLRMFTVLDVKAFYSCFFILGLITIVASLLFLLLKKEDGESLIHHD